MPQDYDLILVDGPPGNIGRYGFLYNLELFRQDVTIIFDDVQRADELKFLVDTAQRLQRSYVVHTCKDGKKFGVLAYEKE